jgi:DNA replication protein DnaC
MNSTSFDVPPRYVDDSAAKALASRDARCRSFALGWQANRGVLLLGRTGTGKSLSAAQALRRVVCAVYGRHWACWVRADELSRILASREHAGEIEQIKSALVLVVDEVGYERFPELLLEVLGARYDRGLPTVVTSGLRLEALSERYGAATVRRITDVGGGCVVDLWAQQKPGATSDWGPPGLPPAVLHAQTHGWSAFADGPGQWFRSAELERKVKEFIQ